MEYPGHQVKNFASFTDAENWHGWKTFETKRCSGAGPLIPDQAGEKL
jgi:hypothetical protein